MSRVRIAIKAVRDETWIASFYYIRNLLAGLALLAEAEQPDILVVSDEPASVDELARTGYQRLLWMPSAAIEGHPDALGIDVVFPFEIPELPSARFVSWIPDLQEHHRPDYFTVLERSARRRWHERCLEGAGVVVSSESTRRDVEGAYDDPEGRVHVVRFASYPEAGRPDEGAIRLRYGVEGRFAFCPNQLWIHKNQIAVLAALRILKERGVMVTALFSGKEHDDRATGYGELLRTKARDWGIEDQARFLGFLPRDEQLALFAAAHFVVQPSHSEGWSTAIEDAKALGVHVVASDLPVHREQLGAGADLFRPTDPSELAAIMERLWTAPRLSPREDYRTAQRAFPNAFMVAIRRVLAERPAPPRRGLRQLDGLRALLSNAGAGGRAPSVDSSAALNALATAIRSEGGDLAEYERWSRISATLAESELGGLDFREQPYAPLGLDGYYHWLGGTLTLRRRALRREASRLVLRFRNEIEGQGITLLIDGEAADRRAVEAPGLDSRQEVVFDLGRWLGEEHSLGLSVDRTKRAGGRDLGVIVEWVDLLPGPDREPDPDGLSPSGPGRTGAAAARSVRFSPEL